MRHLATAAALFAATLLPGGLVGADASTTTTAPRGPAATPAIQARERSMVKVALYVRLEAKPGQEAALEAFLRNALPIAQGEATTPVWFALKFGPRSFGIFDAFIDEPGRQAHLEGAIARALLGRADELLASPPVIEKIDLLAAKVPG